jgi:glycosyltransferase involved in cell wall biosynthesis
LLLPLSDSTRSDERPALPRPRRPPRVAIVHEWFVTCAGSERVVAQLLRIFPDAQLFSVVDFLSEEDRDGFLGGRHSKTTFIQRLPRAAKSFRSYLPLMPLAIEQHDLSHYDIVISSSHAVAKGVLTGPDQLHISYVHSPIRYAWDLQHQYLAESGLTHSARGWIAKAILHYMRMWDERTAHGVDHFVANSAFIARRINKVYRREAEVVYPPVDTAKFQYREQKEAYYVTASRMVPYKRVPLIVEAFAKMPERRLVVIGDGPEYERARALAAPNVTLLGYQPDAVLREHLQGARAFVFAAEEDFGITTVEAQACGTPVIAFGKGGALETVRALDQSSSPTGLFFYEQTVPSIVEAVARFEANRARFRPAGCRENAERFSTARFEHEMRSLVERAFAQHETRKRESERPPTLTFSDAYIEDGLRVCGEADVDLRASTHVTEPAQELEPDASTRAVPPV